MDNNIGCVSIEVYPIGKPLDLECFRMMETANDLYIEVYPIGKPLTIECFRVCSINTDAYLRTSTDVVWLTPDMIAEQFDIYSNVVWNII